MVSSRFKFFICPVLLLAMVVVSQAATTCYNIDSSSPNGTCSSNDTCACNYGYINRYPSTDARVCGGNGYCTPPVLKKYGPFGAGGGSLFSDVSQNTYVDKLLFYGGSWIDTCQFAAGNYTSPKYPNGGGTQITFALQANEMFTSMTIYSSNVVKGINAKTNLGRSYQIGPQSGTSFTYNLLQGETIYGFFGYTDGYLRSIGFYVQALGSGCVCNNNYYGSACNTYSCYGIMSRNPTACSGSGNCTAPDTCQCNLNYFGQQCDGYTCNNLMYNHTKACGGFNAGLCTAPNTCVCRAGYSGSNCEIYYCNGKLFNTTGVCGSGACTGANICTCPPGYGGPTCNIYGTTNLIDIFLSLSPTVTNAVTYSSCCQGCSTPACFPSQNLFGYNTVTPQQVLYEHPTSTKAYFAFNISGSYKWFTGQFAIENSFPGYLSASVVADGVTLYDTGVVDGFYSIYSFSVNLTGVNVLTLAVDPFKWKCQ
ncbi:von Willebrand factor D and EGF domain-containing protein [Acrasis kona]|uniref:von Willebrand factor D and EGF domain-containing protein n=1 Tax=Acrasis kona TaxID=1008807 RepID=A0AAW2YJS9_9EUKA